MKEHIAIAEFGLENLSARAWDVTENLGVHLGHFSPAAGPSLPTYLRYQIRNM